MMKAAADFYKQKPVPLAGFMPRKAPRAPAVRTCPRAMAYDMAAIHDAKPRAAQPNVQIRTVQAGASLRKSMRDTAVTSASFGTLLKKRARQADALIERLDRLAES